MRADVIIATAGRAPLLEKALAALAAQDLPADQFGVEVVIDGNDAASVEVLRRFAGRFHRLRWRETGVRRGPAVARNLALRATSAPVVAITDDDCIPSPGWLPALLAELDGDPSVGVVIGKTTTDKERLDPFSHYVENLEGRTHQTCNIAYRRSVLEQLDGFDERFPFSLEDTDLYFRAEQVTRAVFAPEAVVHHPPRQLTVMAVARSARRFEGDFLFYHKHPALYRRRHGGLAPLSAVLWEVGVKYAVKQVLTQARWLAKNPLTYLRYVTAMVLFEAVLWTHTPLYWWRHRVPLPPPSTPRRETGAGL